MVDDSRSLLEILEQAKIETTKKISVCLGLKGRENQVGHREARAASLFRMASNVPVVTPQSSGHADPL